MNPPTLDEPRVPLAQRKTINTLMPDDCRWPIGDPQAAGFHFCGAQKVEGSPYCAFHMAKGFQPSRPRQASYRSRDAA